MKKILTLFALGALTFLGTTVETEARAKHGYHAPASTVYISGYKHGRPVYTEKYFVGYDRWGRPLFKFRTFRAKRTHVIPHQHCYQPVHRSPYYSKPYSSGTRVTISFGR